MKQHQKKMLNDYLEKGYIEQEVDSFWDGEYLYEEN
jgi:hypothetical protein